MELTKENKEFLSTVTENSYTKKRKKWDLQKKERYKVFLIEFRELWQHKIESNMKTFKLHTISQILTVKNCRNQNEALEKAKLNISTVFKIEEI